MTEPADIHPEKEPPTLLRAWLILNPAAGSVVNAENPVPKILSALAEHGWQIETRETTPDRSAEEIARLAVQERIPYVLVAGGDGTVGMVAKVLAGTDCTLGVIPLGTFNNVARSIGIPGDLDAACAIIAGGHVEAVDAGEIAGRPFFEAAGVGLDATLFPLGEQVKEGQWSRWWDIAQRTIDYPVQKFELHVKGYVSSRKHRRSRRANRVFTRHALLIVIANGPYYGGGFTVSPGARMSDGLLTINIYRNFSKLELLRHFFSIRRGKVRSSAKVESFRAREVEIRTSRQVPVHADGEQVGNTPVTIRAIPAALHVFAPSDATNAEETAGATRETEDALRKSFAEVKNRADAANIIARMEHEAPHEDDEARSEQRPASPAEQSGAIRSAVEGASNEDKPAAALAETSAQIAASDDPEALDEAIREAGKNKDEPAVEHGRQLLRQELLRRLKPVDAVDTAVFLQVNQLPHPPALTGFFSRLSWAMTGGHAWLIVILLGLLVDRKKGLGVARTVIPAMYLSTFLVEVPIKKYFRRKRPFVSIVRAVVVGRKPGSFSFPSGHSAAAFAGAGLLATHYPRLRPLFFGIAGLVGFSRVYLGAHYPGDVLIGGLLGASLARGFRALLRKITGISRR